MKKGFFVFLAAAILLMAPAVHARPESEMAESAAPPAYDGYLILLPEEEKTERRGLLQALEPGMEYVIPGVLWTEDRAEAEKMLADGRAVAIEPNYTATLFDLTAGSGPAGWAYSAMGAAYPHQHKLDGTGVRIGIIDSGVDRNNQNLQQAHIVAGYDYLQQSSSVTDDVYHGTKVTQIIAGDGKTGPLGIAPGAEIVPLRCFSVTESATVKLLAQVIEKAVDDYHCDVINMSWGVRNDSTPLHNAIQYAADRGVLLVAASGNVSSQFSQGTVLYPAAYEEVIGVSAIDASLKACSFSQNTEAVFVCAPGYALPFCDAGGKETMDSGTSYSSPCVAGAAAVLRQLAPEMKTEELSALLRERAVDLGTAGYDKAYGYGFVQIKTLLETPWAFLKEQTVYGWDVEGNCGHILFSSYNSENRMQSVAEIHKKGSAFTLKSGEEGVSAVKLFYLNQNYVPLYPGQRMSAR